MDNKQRTIKGWIEKSHKIPGLEGRTILVYDFQSIGRADIFLKDQWLQIKDNLNNPVSSIKYNYYCIFARLWLIAAYELVRIILKFDKRKEVEELYQKFRRVRIPLVKFEKVKDRNGKIYIERYPGDFDLILLAHSKIDGEFGWAVSEDTIITREELAQGLYDLF